MNWPTTLKPVRRETITKLPADTLLFTRGKHPPLFFDKIG